MENRCSKRYKKFKLYIKNTHIVSVQLCCVVIFIHQSLVLCTISSSDMLVLFYFAYIIMIIIWYDSMIELRDFRIYSIYTTKKVY